MADKGLKIKERIIIFGPIILVIIIVSFFFNFKQTSKQGFYKYVVPSEFHGIVVKKYRHWNHYEPRIKYKHDSAIIDMSTFNWIELYNNVEIGDSIYKIKGDTVLYLKKKQNNSILKFNYFFDKGWGVVKRQHNKQN